MQSNNPATITILFEQFAEIKEQLKQIRSGQTGYLTHSEAAARLRISESYLRTLPIVFYRSNGGKLRYYKIEDLDKWALCHRIGKDNA